MSLVLLLRKIVGMWNRLGSTDDAVLGLSACLSEILIFYPLEFECSFVFRVRLRNDRIGRFVSQLAAFSLFILRA